MFCYECFWTKGCPFILSGSLDDSDIDHTPVRAGDCAASLQRSNCEDLIAVGVTSLATRDRYR